MVTSAEAQTRPAPLALEVKIPLGPISGRVDHLAVELMRQRLLVAEPGYDTNHSNFSVAIDRHAHRLFVVFRSPAHPVVMSAADGSVVGSLDTCGNAIDVFVDTKRHRVPCDPRCRRR